MDKETNKEIATRVSPALLEGKNVFIICENPVEHTNTLLNAFAEMKSDGDKMLIIIQDEQNASSIQKLAEGSKLSVYVETPTGKAGALDEADIILGTTEELLLTIQEKPFTAKLTACIGFVAGRGLPSAELESLLESADCKQAAWLSSAAPLALSSLINKYFKTDGCVEINMEQENESGHEASIEHVYYEVSRDLLSKPNALCDLIDIAGRPPTLIYCNQPSDTDLIEVMLKKRGILASKMIGHVPDRAVHAAAQQIQNGELQVLVVTDISAQNIPVDEFEMIINHATPEDPEVYLHRLGTPSSDGKLKSMISLVGANDLGNFHYLKKIVEFDFKQKQLPTDEERAKARVQNIIDAAKQKSETFDNEVLALTKELMACDATEEVLAHLLHNTLRVIPELESQQGKKSRRSDRRRNDRYESDDDRSRSDDNDRSSGRDRKRDRSRERVQLEPAKKDVRFYLGSGSSAGMTEEVLEKIVSELDVEGLSEWKRHTIRELYSFADIPEESAEEVLEKLKGYKLKDGSELYCCKATEIPEPRKPIEESEDSEDSSNKEESDDDSTLEASASA